ncbi:hypothetical protein Ddye_013698 [Dipteronia dyeriana]|uniref:Protein SHORTAGE IN CHIASMATA 1 n=1 Tax=Dipteronia dyeriana TaxID=168575 RepID=A0AAD9X6W5_9ROSI|nr:hypothetical protein Ddye_013698 [Dipteronia dyeriana]
MRTRFLNIDYFAPSSSPIETLGFLKLPVPHLPPSRLSSCNDGRDLLHLSFESVLDVSLDIDQLPIHSALSKFFSDSIPQLIDVDLRSFEAVRSPIRDVEKESDILYEEKEEEGQRAFGSEISEEAACDDKYTHGFEVIQFETPELAAFSENDILSENEEIQILSEVLEIDNNLNMLKPGFALWYPNEVQESVYSVEDVALDYRMEQKSYMLEDDGSSPDQMLFQCISFPLFEVDEISLGILSSHTMEDALLSVLENTELLWTQKDLLINGKEILGSMEYDILDLLSDHSLSKQCLEPEMAVLEFPEMDFISMVESSQLKEISEFHLVMADDECFSSMSPVIFQEFQMFDLDSSQIFEVFFSTQTNREEATCKWMFKDMNFKNFNELIISHELALVDDTFKSLPIPVLSDPEKTNSVYAVVEEMLAELKPQPLSASDGIYLDWHLLDEDKCSCKFFYPRQKILEEMDFRKIDLDLKFSDDGEFIYDFIFCDDASTGPNVEGYEPSLNIISDGISMLDDQLMGITSGELLDNGCPKPRNGEQSVEKNAKRASVLFKSMSQFNDLDFFLNPHKAITGEKDEFLDNTKVDIVAPPSKSVLRCASTGTQLQQWDLTLHKVKLSDNIVALVDIFEKSYLTILKNETELSSYLASDDFTLLSLPKQQLMSRINEKLLQKASCHGDENIVAFVTLCSIKQMAWYTCFYGIHTARLYVNKLYQSLDSLKPRLGFLLQLMVDADRKDDEDITRSHPSLPVIQGILRSNTTHCNLKVLILSEKVFWWSLKRLLTSMGLSFNELENLYANVDNVSEFAKSAMDALLISDCLLVSYELVSASFPFNKFSFILEYGGSKGSSIISSLSPKLAGLPLHFIKVELDESTASRALCQGVDMPQNMKAEGNSIQAINESMCGQKLQELLNFIPMEDRCNLRSHESADKVEGSCMPLSVPFSPFAMESEHIQPSMESYPNAVIIVNTQSFDKEMIISRRSTYQKILAMEKEGVQVVERDSDLPVDVISSSASCLVWYDCSNIGKKSSALDEASSCLPLCVDNIATNVLTLLSLPFSSCILVFEGETDYISTVMESSDGLYAAAATLGIDLQLFYSHTSELTDEIILSCIGDSIKLTRGLYPKMPESETIAESFLTKFPSVNPLTAHAMLSSGGMLIEFFDCSHEHRIMTMRKYHVPDESIILFSALCNYGERDDSKSIITDCSSSVSSGPDSDKCHLNIDFGRKQRKCISSPDKIDIRIDELLHFEPLDQFTNGFLNPSGVSKPYNSWKDPEIFDEHCKPSSSFNDLFGKDQELDFDMMMKPSRISKPYGSQILEGPEVLKGIRDPHLFSKEKNSGQKQGSKIARMNDLDWHNSESNNPFEDFTGEVIDLTSNILSRKDLSSVPTSSYDSPSMPDKYNSERKCKIARRLSFGKSNHTTFPTAAAVNSSSDTLNPTFPTAADINSDSDILSSFKQTRGSSQGPDDHPENNYRNDKLLSEQRKKPLEEVLARRFAGSKGVSFQEEISHFGRTPLSDAIRSAHPQPGSPWTIEFLNRIREKSRLRQQSRPCDTAAPSFGNSGNISKATKRRSPSILEFFKYQGGSTPRNKPEKKKEKQSMQSSISTKNKRPSASFLPTWTPTDKRARQTLSFSKEGGNQTKLVWSDESPYDPRKRFRS